MRSLLLALAILIALCAALADAAPTLPAAPAPRLIVLGDATTLRAVPALAAALPTWAVEGRDVGTLAGAWAAAPSLPPAAVVVLAVGLADAAADAPVAAFVADYRIAVLAIRRATGARVLATTLWAGAGEPSPQGFMSEELRVLAREFNIPLADVAAATAGCAPVCVAEDGRPSAAGAAQIAAVLRAAVAPPLYLPALSR